MTTFQFFNVALSQGPDDNTNTYKYRDGRALSGSYDNNQSI